MLYNIEQVGRLLCVEFTGSEQGEAIQVRQRSIQQTAACSSHPVARFVVAAWWFKTELPAGVSKPNGYRNMIQEYPAAHLLYICYAQGFSPSLCAQARARAHRDTDSVSLMKMPRQIAYFTHRFMLRHTFWVSLLSEIFDTGVCTCV